VAWAEVREPLFNLQATESKRHMLGLSADQGHGDTLKIYQWRKTLGIVAAPRLLQSGGPCKKRSFKKSNIREEVKADADSSCLWGGGLIADIRSRKGRRLR